MVNNKTLDELANFYKTDKGTEYYGSSRHGYAPIYDSILSKWRSLDINMLEIGICMEGTEGGHSVRMWQDYFEKAKIYTFDIVDMSRLENQTIKFYQGNQSKRDDFEKMLNKFNNPKFEFILEDGSHIHEHQIISFAALFQHIVSDGYYIMEDVTIPDRPVCCQRNDKTYETIINFIKTKKFESQHILPEEQKYLEENIKDVQIHDDIQKAYTTIIFQKK